MNRDFYVHEINVPQSSALVEIEADGPVFLVTFAAYANYLHGEPLDAIMGRYGERHVVLRPTKTGSWYLAAYSPCTGRYRLLFPDNPSDWVDFHLKATGFG